MEDIINTKTIQHQIKNKQTTKTKRQMMVEKQYTQHWVLSSNTNSTRDEFSCCRRVGNYYYTRSTSPFIVNGMTIIWYWKKNSIVLLWRLVSLRCVGKNYIFWNIYNSFHRQSPRIPLYTLSITSIHLYNINKRAIDLLSSRSRSRWQVQYITRKLVLVYKEKQH